VPVFKMKVVYL